VPDKKCQILSSSFLYLGVTLSRCKRKILHACESAKAYRSNGLDDLCEYTGTSFRSHPDHYRFTI